MMITASQTVHRISSRNPVNSCAYSLCSQDHADLLEVPDEKVPEANPDGLEYLVRQDEKVTEV